MKILIAEDDSASRLVVTRLLRQWGYEPVAVTDGRAALAALLQPDGPHLAILDWVMPGLDGLEVSREVRKQVVSAPVYIILLTARDRQEDIVRGLEAGANDYVIKPYGAGELRARVNVGRRLVELQLELRRRIGELQDALAHVKKLQGILPICAYCHRILTDELSWKRIESYLMEHTDLQLSHGICAECERKELAKIETRLRTDVVEEDGKDRA